MRTTVTSDEDVERWLRETMHRTRRGFKETLNDAIRMGLARNTAQARSAPFVSKARPMGLRPGIAPASLNNLADELETDAFLVKPHKPGAK